MFSQPAADPIAKRCVAVRLTGGDDMTGEVFEFMKRYGVRAYPTLLVMNADGHVVVSDIPPTARGMVDALDRGAASETEFARLSGKEDDASRVRLADMLVERREYASAEALYRAVVEESPSAELHARIADLYRRSGQHDRERSLLTVMLGLYPDADDNMRWRLRLATIDFDVRRMRTPEEFARRIGEARSNVEEIFAGLVPGETPEDEAEVRAELANLLLLTREPDAAERHAAWIVENQPRHRVAAPALMILANVAVQRREHAACKAYLLRILAEHPSSGEAKNAPRLLARLEQILDQEAGPPAGPETDPDADAEGSDD